MFTVKLKLTQALMNVILLYCGFLTRYPEENTADKVPMFFILLFFKVTTIFETNHFKTYAYKKFLEVK